MGVSVLERSVIEKKILELRMLDPKLELNSRILFLIISAQRNLSGHAINRVQQCTTNFSVALVPEVFVPFIFLTEISKKSSFRN